IRACGRNCVGMRRRITGESSNALERAAISFSVKLDALSADYSRPCQGYFQAVICRHGKCVDGVGFDRSSYFRGNTFLDPTSAIAEQAVIRLDDVGVVVAVV